MLEHEYQIALNYNLILLSEKRLKLKFKMMWDALYIIHITYVTKSGQWAETVTFQNTFFYFFIFLSPHRPDVMNQVFNLKIDT